MGEVRVLADQLRFVYAMPSFWLLKPILARQVCSVLRDSQLPTSVRASCAELLSLVANELRQAPSPSEAAWGGLRQSLLAKLQQVVQHEVGAAAARAILQNMHASEDWQLLASHIHTASLSAVALVSE